MFRFILKLLALGAAVFAAFAAISCLGKASDSDYIEIYSDDEDTF